MNPARVKRLGLFALVLSLLTLAATTYLAYVNLRHFRAAAESVQHARRLLQTNTQVLSHLIDAETGERGYLLTGRLEYLDPYRQAVQDFAPDINELLTLTGDLPSEHERARLIQALAETKLAEIRHTIDLRRTQGMNAALAVVQTDFGKRTMDQLRAVLGDLTRDEEDRRQASWDALESDAQTTRWITLLSSALLAALVGIGGVALSHAAARQESLTQAAASSRDLLHTTLYSIGDAVISTDPRGRVNFLNPVAERLTGFSEAEAAGRPIEEVFHIVNEDTRAEVESPVRRVLREGHVVGLANHTSLVSRSGAETPIDDSGAPIRSKTGDIEGAVLVFRDITERKKAQEELRLSERRFRAVADSAPVMICSDTAGGLRDYCNLPWLQFTGRTFEQEAAHGWKEGIHPDDRAHFDDSLARAFEDRAPYSLEFRLRRHDGHYAWVLGRGVPRFDASGQFHGYMASFTDIDDRRRAEQQLRQAAKLESLGVLAGGIAHDFNNLLVAIMGNASLLEDSLPPATPNRDLLSHIVEASERAALLTRQMLAYSGQGRFIVEPVQLSEQVRQITALIHASVPKTVDLRLSLTEPLPRVEADASQIQQLVMNLVINGAEAIGPDGGTLEVSTGTALVDARQIAGWLFAEDLRPGSYVFLAVRDTGCGMNPETQARVFDPFFTTKFTGRGLGLAAAQGIVRGHKGGIHLVSAPGQGTTFQIFLPAAPARREPPPEPPPALSRRTGLALVVDDEAPVQDAARRALERAGYSVLVASRGEEAVELLSRNGREIQVIVLDMTMPGMSGEETLGRLRSLRPDLPIILSSGYGEAVAQQRFGSQIDSFLEKPYTMAAFDRALQAALARRGRRTQAGT